MVEAALARGWATERIAKAVGISPASIKRYFRAELKARDQAQDKLALAAFARLVRSAVGEGNMSAMRQLREELARDALTRKEREINRRQEEAEDAGIGALGKKEQAAKEAGEVLRSGSWSGILPGYEH